MLTAQYKENLTDMVQAHREQLQEEKAVAVQQDKEFTSNVNRLADAFGDKPNRPKLVSSRKGNT